jgi:hypothetical protein
MTEQNPITPPPKLIKDWHDEWNESDQIVHSAYTHIAIRAARWGSDQELEACCEWLGTRTVGFPAELRAARRPKPPSLKEQALSSLTRLVVDLDRANMRDQATILEGPIRRALEQLDD